MGFDLSFTLSRGEVLTASELDTLEQHLRAWRGRIINYDWHVPDASATGPLIAWGELRPTRGQPDVSDEGGYLVDVVEALHDALAELRDELRGVTLAFADSFGALAWIGIGFSYRRDAAYPEVPEAARTWSSLALSRGIPEGHAAREQRPRTKKAARAAIETADRDRLIAYVRAPLNGRVTDVERTAAVEQLGLDPDERACAVLVERMRADGMQRKWTAPLLRILAAAPRRCSWATALLAFDRGFPGSAQLLMATVTEDAVPSLARLPVAPPWNALAVQALDAVGAEEARAARITRADEPALAVTTAALAAQRVLRTSASTADPAVREALAAVAAAVAAQRDPQLWVASERRIATKALALLDGKRVTQDVVNRGLAALAAYATSGRIDPPHRLSDELRSELWELEAQWLATRAR